MIKEDDQVLRHFENIELKASKTSSPPFHLPLKSSELLNPRRRRRQDGSKNPRGLVVRLGEKKGRKKKKRERKKKKKKERKKNFNFFFNPTHWNNLLMGRNFFSTPRTS